MYIDTHAHLNFSAFKADAEEVIRRSLEAGVFIINAGSQYSTSKRAVEMAEKYGIGACPHTKEISQIVLNDITSSGFNINDFGVGVYAAVGLHPIHISTHNQQPTTDNEDETKEIFDYEKYLGLARNPKVVAIGEMGLDYYYIGDGDVVAIRPLQIAKQKEVFLEGIKLANEAGKPMMIHCREAYAELLEILKNNPIDKKGVIHCFVGSLKTAQEFIRLGFKIGLNGIITYSESYDKLIKNIKLEDILLETDCPYLNPKPLPRNGRNEPWNVKYVAEKISQVKEININEVEKITTTTALEVFQLDTR